MVFRPSFLRSIIHPACDGSFVRRSVGIASCKWPPNFGETLPSEPSAEALAEFLRKRHKADPLRFPDLSLTIVKLLGAGEYVLELPGEESVGHFGLAVRDYTHSTAPNRRYPDLITQRLLKAAIAGTPFLTATTS